ncbi:MAG TPA: YgeY family selenium metabolism-linked hydrolase [Myxococcota bacterium]|nr:YgeY family selenium metabolism-linked hydrolase [Myxococcota bacterium]HQK51623.1 YgeY family selenium metabolism-linked hydrolase [Myxococcota bacterium]
MAATRILERARELEQETAEFLCEMIRIPSYSGQERGVIERIAARMRDAGLDEVRIDGLGNVIGRLGSGPRMVAFDAHIDTVETGDLSAWKTPPFDARIEGGQVIGRGSVDQEGGMASMVTAARLIREMDLNRDFTILFTGTVMEEDCDGLCWDYLIREEGIRPELVVITEPTNLNLYRGHRGRMEIKVRTRGLSCHGSAPERGINAIYRMARVALEIERLHGELRDDPFLGKGSVTISEFRSSSPSLCAVADGAEIHLDRRLTAGETRESAIGEVLEAARRAGVEVEVEVPVYRQASWTGRVHEMDKYFPTWVIPEDSPWVGDARTAFAAVFGRPPVVDKWTFSTNGVTIMGVHGIPCIGFGPGNEVMAHAPNEACPTEHLSAAAAFYAALVAHWNGRL